MTRVVLREPLAKEHVAEVAAAVGALNLDALTVRVGQTFHGADDLIIEGRPAAVSVELILGAVEPGVAAAANVGAGFIEVIVLAGEWRFGTSGLDHVPLAGRELVVLRVFHGQSYRLSGTLSAVYRNQAAAWVSYVRQIGFTRVYDYLPGKADWFAAGLPGEGTRATIPHAGDVARRDEVTCRLGGRVGDVPSIVVTSSAAPATVRSSGT